MYRTMRVSDEVYKKIKACAKQEKRTLKTILEIAIVNYLQKRILEK